MAEIEPRRVGNPRWTKGISGNPGGRPKSEKEIRRLIQLKSPRLLKKLLAIYFDDAHPCQGIAIREIWNRGYGKPSESIKISGGVTVEERKRVVIERAGESAN